MLSAPPDNIPAASVPNAGPGGPHLPGGVSGGAPASACGAFDVHTLVEEPWYLGLGAWRAGVCVVWALALCTLALGPWGKRRQEGKMEASSEDQPPRIAPQGACPRGLALPRPLPGPCCIPRAHPVQAALRAEGPAGLWEQGECHSLGSQLAQPPSQTCIVIPSASPQPHRLPSSPGPSPPSCLCVRDSPPTSFSPQLQGF